MTARDWGRWHFEASPANLPLPRLVIYREEDAIDIGVQIVDAGSDAVVGLRVRVPWKRPRPWYALVMLPAPARGWNEWTWRRPPL